MQVVTFSDHNTNQQSQASKAKKPVTPFILAFSNVGIMRCPVDSDGNVLDGQWLNENQLIESLNESLEISKQVNSLNKELSNQSAAMSTTRRLFDDRLLYENADAVVWYSSANRVLPQYYTDKNFSSIPHPQLVFFASKKINRMSVVATNSKLRPDLSTPIYHAPLANIYDDTHLCQGSAHLPPQRNSSTIIEMEDTLLKSRYSGFKFDSIKGCNGHAECVRFYKDIDGDKEFPLDRLVTYRERMTLELWIESQFKAIGGCW